MLLKQMMKVRSKQYYFIVGEDRKVRVQGKRGSRGTGGGRGKGRRREFLKGVKQGKEKKILLCNNVQYFLTLTFISTCENTKCAKDFPKGKLLGAAPLSLPFPPLPPLLPLPPPSSPVSVLTCDFSLLSG